MAVLQTATPEMFDGIYPLLATLNPAFPKEKWRILVDYRWRAAGDDLGYVLVDDGRIVGFISTLYSRRTIGGKEFRLCNTAHWVVREEYRSESMRLFLAVMRQRDCTITNLTSSTTVAALMPKLGFRLLEERLRLFFPEPVIPRSAARGAPSITTDPTEIDAVLGDADRRIFLDHAGSQCEHVVVRDGAEYCYLVFTRKQRPTFGVRVPYCHLQYISHRDLFHRHLPRLKWFFLVRLGAWFLAADERLVGEGGSRFSWSHALGIPRYFRTPSLAADQVDNLYTELVLGL